MRIEAKTLEEAYLKASEAFNASINDLDIEIIQYPSKGLLGLFSKPAIIEVREIPKSIDDIIKEIKKGLINLFKNSCFKIDEVDVKKIDEETLKIKLDGEDAALLIGKEGYRYNALNYMIYSWIYQKYGFKTKLEIAEFLKNQEAMLRNFLAPFIEKVREKGYGRTKAFDGILAYLALEILREAFPNKYVALKERNGEKYVVIGERYGHNSSNSDS